MSPIHATWAHWHWYKGRHTCRHVGQRLAEAMLTSPASRSWIAKCFWQVLQLFLIATHSDGELFGVRNSTLIILELLELTGANVHPEWAL